MPYFDPALVPRDVWRLVAIRLHSDDRKQLVQSCRFLSDIVWSLRTTAVTLVGTSSRLSLLPSLLGRHISQLASLYVDNLTASNLANLPPSLTSLRSAPQQDNYHVESSVLPTPGELVAPHLHRLKAAEVGIALLPWIVQHTSMERLFVHLPALESLSLLSIPSTASLPLLRTLTLSRDIYVCCDDDSFRNSLSQLPLVEELHLSVRPRADIPSASFPSLPRMHTLSVCVNFPTIELAAITAANLQLTSLSFTTFVRAVETIRMECLSALKGLRYLSMTAGSVSRYECFFEQFLSQHSQDTMLVPHKHLTYLSMSHIRPWQVVPDASFLVPLLTSLRELHIMNERAYQRLVGPLSRPLLLSALHALTLSDSSVSAAELILLFQDVNFPSLRSLTLTSTTATYVARLGTLIEVSCTGLTSLSLTVPHHLLSWTLPSRMPRLLELAINFYSVLPLHSPLSISCLMSLSRVQRLTLAHVGPENFQVTTSPHWSLLYSLPLLTLLRLQFRSAEGKFAPPLSARRSGLRVEGPFSPVHTTSNYTSQEPNERSYLVYPPSSPLSTDFATGDACGLALTVEIGALIAKPRASSCTAHAAADTMLHVALKRQRGRITPSSTA